MSSRQTCHMKGVSSMSDADSDSFPIMNSPLSPDTIVAYRLRRDSDKHISTGKVKQAGFYVILVTNESGHEEFVFYDELMAVQESIYMSIDPNKLCVGCIIRYRLLPAQNPTTPDRLWRGKILSLHIGMPDSLDVALVENLDIGY